MTPARENPVPALKITGSKTFKTGKNQEQNLEKFLQTLTAELSMFQEQDFYWELKDRIKNHSALACAYVLNPADLQITGTIFNNRDFSPCRQIFFKPDEKRADPSFREYFMRMGAGVKKHLTEPYISAASGIFCRMVSGLFQNLQGFNFILCFFFRN